VCFRSGVTDAAVLEPAEGLREGTRRAIRGRVAAAALAAIALGNAAWIVWLWAHGGNLQHLSRPGDLLTSLGRITGLLGAYLALVQVLLLARLPALERLAGFDRLTRWHRWNGHACLELVLAHVVLIVWGYALLDRFSVGHELSTMLGGGVYPGMITATVGTGLFVAVVVTSLVVVRRLLRYEWWQAIHLAAYAGIALAWFHEIPTGNELVVDTVAADYWRAIAAATLALLVVYRFGMPVLRAFRHRLRVESVVVEGPGVVSVRIGGRRLDRLGARAGQFFLWRFLDRRRWWSAHPFSLSARPDGRSLRITVKALGDFSARLAEVRPGTRVLAEGPFGTFTAAARRRERALLIAGGIGVTPIRALLEELGGDVVVLYRAIAAEDLVLAGELDALAAERGARVHHVVGDHAAPGGDRLLSPEHLRELVPDLDWRDVFLCGPPGMTAAIERSLRAARVPRSHVHIERFAL
jgi:predicted ferric reductase